MTMAFSSKVFHPIMLLVSLLLVIHSSKAQTNLPIVPGLSWTFYNTSCPRVETIIRNRLTQIFQNDSAQAAGLLRLHFHDCFVQGCDGSVLLDGSASGPSEKNAPPNLSLRPQSFTIINELRDLVQRNCGRVVSCSDIVAIAARDSVAWSGGPDYRVPLGRRDGLTFATQNETLRNLPPPTSSAGALLAALSANQNLSATDLVALSGGHTIGFSSCFSFRNRLFPTQDFTMNLTLASSLRTVCPTNTTNNFTFLDPHTPRAFDNQYYINLVNREGLFTSDQDLFTDVRTSNIVNAFAVNQTRFFEEFVRSMVKMGQLSVLTGSQGEIRGNCSARNAARAVDLASVVVDGRESGGGSTATF